MLDVELLKTISFSKPSEAMLILRAKTYKNIKVVKHLSILSKLTFLSFRLYFCTSIAYTPKQLLELKNFKNLDIK